MTTESIRDFSLLVPLGLLLLGLLRKDRFIPHSGLFAEQSWSCSDVLLVLLLVIGLGGLGLIGEAAGVSRLTVDAITLSLQALLTMTAIYLLMRLKYGSRLSVIGLSRAHALYYMMWSLKVVLAISTVISMLTLLLVLARHSWNELALSSPMLVPTFVDGLRNQSSHFIAMAALYFLSLVAFMPCAEELFFRGFLYSPLLRKFGSSGAMLMAAMIFATMHGLSARTVTAFVFGLFYLYMYRRTESLIPSLTLHMAGNTAVVFIAAGANIEHAEKLLVPTVVLSAGCFLFCAFAVRRLRPSDPAVRLAWSN